MNDKFVPESVLAKLVVGQRVRYVPVGECGCGPPMRGSLTARYQATNHEAHSNAESKTGQITAQTDLRIPGHPYLVKMDVRFEFGGRTWGTITAAAHELALVED